MDCTIATFKYIKHEEDTQSAQNPGSYNFSHPCSMSITMFFEKLIEIELIRLIDRDDPNKPISDPTCNPYFYLDLYFEYFGENNTSQRQIIVISNGEDIKLYPAEVVHLFRGLSYKITGFQASEKHREMIKIAIDKYKESL